MDTPADADSRRRTIFFPEVEALRGVAAFMVAVYHLLEVRSIDPHTFDVPTFDAVANYFLTTLFNGTGAVIVFFVISGFVLGCNVHPDSILSARFYGAFAIRRLFRIMPALWLSLAVAIAII